MVLVEPPISTSKIYTEFNKSSKNMNQSGLDVASSCLCRKIDWKMLRGWFSKESGCLKLRVFFVWYFAKKFKEIEEMFGDIFSP